MFVAGGDDQRVQRAVALRRSANASTAARSVMSSRWAMTSRPAAASSMSRAGARRRARARRRRRRPARWRARCRSRRRRRARCARRARPRQASRPAPARKTLNSGGGGPSASRAKASGPVLERPHRGQLADRARCPLDQPLVGLLEVGHRVRVGALEAVLAAHDAVEAERRVVGGQADADRLPAGAQQLERRGARGLRADRVEHEVGAEPVGRLAHGLGASSPSPKTACAPSASARSRRCAWGSRTRDVRDARQQRGLQRDEPDRPGAEHHALAPRGRRRARAAPRARRWPAARSARRPARTRRRAARARWPPARATRSANAPSSGRR